MTVIACKFLEIFYLNDKTNKVWSKCLDRVAGKKQNRDDRTSAKYTKVAIALLLITQLYS
ncbi:hypothetical protein I8748_07615 [Nostoc sp. CENA67]|uniref:Uncharacterized protein n=1 Tax=Amazonocrinis nigriterrae CENA67 TaxID=2794033 RepID=A0A8J7HR58_9NOST|nr:hypothetical protein [Amazonocrinis nigriterrae]MBH8562040.1 hypothetical protein [Amazonocrinis nigriterrae CENA67]